jgi:hypothetical protein
VGDAVKDDHARVDRRRGQYFIQASSRTDVGLWIADGEVFTLPDTCSDEELGTTIRAALAQSRWHVPHPARDRLEHVGSALLAAAGVKSHTAFAKGATSVGVEDEGDAVVVIPYHREPGVRGSYADEANVFTIDSPTPAALGATVREALAHTTSG